MDAFYLRKGFLKSVLQQFWTNLCLPTEFQQQNQLQVQQSSIHSSQPKITTIFISDSLRHKKLTGAI